MNKNYFSSMVKENTALENLEVLLDQIKVSTGRLSPTSILVTIVTCYSNRNHPNYQNVSNNFANNATRSTAKMPDINLKLSSSGHSRYFLENICSFSVIEPSLHNNEILLWTRTWNMLQKDCAANWGCLYLPFTYVIILGNKS